MWGFCFKLAFRAFSSFSSVVPPLTQLHPSSLTQRTQLISHNTSPLTTYITHLTQLISHNSTRTTHLTQLISHISTHSRAAFVWHLVELLSCPLTELHPSSFTQLLSSHNSHNSSHMNMNAFVPPAPAQDYVQGAVLQMTGDQGAVLLCAEEHGRFCHPRPCPRLCSRCIASNDRRSRCSAFCVQRNMNAFVPPRPCPGLCSRCSASDDRRSRCSAFVCRGT